MEYFKLLNLEKEPFSNSPDPDCFFKSRQHQECLQKLELSLRLKRGLNVVIGEVGTGKTTLCRQLIKKFSRDEEFETHLILDPHMADPSLFLKTVAQMFAQKPEDDTDAGNDYKEIIKNHLYKKGVVEDRIVVLIIDEGQKIPPLILEILRELLNYETNEYKLLQIVIFAQSEFEETLEKHANFADRINLLHLLGPLGFKDTRLMIDYRLQKAGSESSLESMLSSMALIAIFRATGGYPRKIVNLCHRVMLAMIVQNKKKAGWRLVRSCIIRSSVKPYGRWRKTAGVLLILGGLAGVAYIGSGQGRFDTIGETGVRQAFPVGKDTVKIPAKPAKDNPAKVQNPIADPEQEKEPAAVKSNGTIAPGMENSNAEPKTAPVNIAGQLEPAETTVAIRPQMLGMIRLEENETLSWAMIKVYGEYTNLRCRKLAESNPGIKNLNNIFSGQAIYFPAIVYEGLGIPGFLNWIRIDSVETISAALETVRRYSSKKAPLRIIPYWSHDRGLMFDVIFWKYFSSKEDAEKYKMKLHDPVRLKSEIIPGWDKAELFYANPRPGIG